MSTRKLKTAIIGITDKGVELLETASKSGLFQITAIGDKDPEAAKELSLKYGCGFFDDFRQLIVRNELDVLIAANPTYKIDEFIRAAMHKKIHIFKVSPPGLGFEQVAEYIRLAHSMRVRFTAANSHRFTPAFADLRDYIRYEGIEKFHLITAVCNTEPYINDVSQRWLTDPELAGGGTLLYDGYDMIDKIVMNFNIPQQVYSLNSNRAPDKQQRLSLTEDTAVITMRFSDTLSGNLIVSRVSGPPEKTLRIHSKDKYLTVTGESFTICDNSGKTIKEFKYDRADEKPLAKMLENFAMHVLEPQKNNLFADGSADLNNMAVIESAYLSARTGTPEEPSRLLDMIEMEPTSIWGTSGKRII